MLIVDCVMCSARHNYDAFILFNFPHRDRKLKCGARVKIVNGVKIKRAKEKKWEEISHPMS